MCRQERVRQGWMDIERGRCCKEKLQTLALDLFQTAYRAFRSHIRHDLLYSPAPPYVEAAVRSIGSYSTRRLSMCTSIFRIKVSMDHADNHRDTTDLINRIDFEDILWTSSPFFVRREWKKRKRERENRELNRFDSEIVSFDSWKSRAPLFQSLSSQLCVIKSL